MTTEEEYLVTEAEKIATKNGYYNYREFLKDTHYSFPKNVSGYIDYIRAKQSQEQTYEYIQREFQFF